MRVSDRDNLTRHERKFIAERMAGKSKIDAARSAFKSKYPAQRAQQTLASPRVRESMQQALIKAGVTPELRAEKLRALLDAEDSMGPDLKLQLDTEKHIADLQGDKAPTKSIVGHVSEESIIERLKREATEE